MLRSGAMTKLTIAMTLIKMFIDGPEVSLKGSPTVSTDDDDIKVLLIHKRRPRFKRDRRALPWLSIWLDRTK